MERRLAALSMLRASAQSHHEIDDRLTGRHVATPPRPEPLVGPTPDNMTQSPLLSTIFDTWVRRKRPSAKTKGHNRLYMNRFIALHGDLPVASVTREQVRSFRDLMERFPRNVPPALEGASPHEVATWADANPAAAKISRTTVNSRAIGALSTLFDTALREALIDANPCHRLKLPLKASDRKEVASFSIEELNVLFAAPEMTGTGRHSKASSGESARWLPLIGLFTGARMEEIAQLEVTDVIKLAGFLAFRITTESENGPKASTNQMSSKAKSLKNESAHRIVPIHGTLIACGFLDYVEKRRKAGDRRLFPQVTAAGDCFAKNWSRWFARFLDKRVSTSASKNFHSFRHTFIDGMRDSLIGRDVIKAIVGHADANVRMATGTAARHGRCMRS
jgi:integrase